MLANVAALLPALPLFERLLILADLHGERIRPAYYFLSSDGGAQAQNLTLAPPSNEGPLVVHSMSVSVSGVALADRKMTIKANGTTYVGALSSGVTGPGIPASFNAPIVVMESNNLTATLVSLTASTFPNPLPAWASGFHCSDRFAKMLRTQGELWGEMISLPANSEPKQITLQRNTMLEFVSPDDTGNIPATATAVSIQLGDVKLTPRDLGQFRLDGTLGFSRMFSNTVMTPRVHCNLKRGDRITVRSNHSAGTLALSFIGRQVFVG